MIAWQEITYQLFNVFLPRMRVQQGEGEIPAGTMLLIIVL
jgi:hypothetical protein